MEIKSRLCISPMQDLWNSCGNPVQSCGNPEGILWTSIEIQWKSYGKPMEPEGNPAEIPWRSYANPMDIMCKFMGNSLETYGNQIETFRQSYVQLWESSLSA